MNITLESITDENIEEITRIYNYYVENTTATYGTEAISPKEFLDYYRINDSLTVSGAVTSDGCVCGFCILRPWNASKRAYEHTYEYSVYLSPDFCGKGLGRQVYGMMEEYIKERDINAVLAGVCSENTASQKMFEALGFDLCGHFKKVGIKFGRSLDILYYEKIYR